MPGDDPNITQDNAGAVTIPNDEFVARPVILSWLAWPYDKGSRTKAVQAFEDLARRRTGQPIKGRKRDVEAVLQRTAREMDKQFLAGEIFRRQVLAAEFNDGFFGNTSTQSFAGRYAAFYSSKYYEKDRENVKRDLWRKRRASLALAVGTCEGMTERPEMEALLFSGLPWAMTALDRAAQFRDLAIKEKHPSAADLINFITAEF